MSLSIEAVIAAAQRYAGCPYVWRGKGRELWSPKGLARHEWIGHVFDCSGLIGQAIKDAGGPDLRATHSAQSYFDHFPVAELADARGVLRLYGESPERVTHVALCLGLTGGQVIVIEAAGGGHRTINPMIAAEQGARVRSGPERRRDYLGSREIAP